MKFRKKPVVIEATQWFKNGDHPLDYASNQEGFQNGRLVSIPAEHRKANNWEGEVVRYFRHPDKAYDGERSCVHCGVIMHKHGWIDTLEGGHIVCPGDWIITGVKGEHYPCKPDIFKQTYEPALDSLNFEDSLKVIGPCCQDYQNCFRPCTPRGRWYGAKEAREAMDVQPFQFPTMLRKMWSGTEVQEWIDRNVNLVLPVNRDKPFKENNQ